ncbi:MAG: hypothetical protein EOO53_16525 [Gammaproteobacteria bacterium]|nr:MAG: hypothetical protein EOO53_16525 [Gammaproteobacteria bacterium]
MESFCFQERFDSLIRIHIRSSSKSPLQRNSPKVLIVIILAHVFLIFIILNTKSKQLKDLPSETVMQISEVKIQNNFSAFVPEIPDLNTGIKSFDLSLPDIKFNEAPRGPLDLSLPKISDSYELPDATSELYKDVFDPKLRKKLQEAHANRKPKKQNTINTWETSGGTTLVDMGDGECIASMPKVDSRQRGTNWSMLRVKCGKTDSEKMMDNVTADLEARKHPLKKSE